LTEALVHKQPYDWIVCELSSFQLKGTSAFRPKISALLNISQAHLDYHHTMDDYISAKSQIIKQQCADDTAIINWDDPVCRSLADQTAASVVPFSMTAALEHGIFLRGHMIVHKDRLGAETTVLAT